MPRPQLLYRRLTDTVMVATPGPTSLSGNPTYSEPVPVRARLERRSKRVTSAETGDEVVSEAQFMTDSPVPVRAQVWLPGADVPVRPVRVDEAATFAGVRLWMVYL